MGIELVLCSLSPKRRGLLQADPGLVKDLLQITDEPVPGLLRLGEAWDALRHIVKPWDGDGALDALLSVEGGEAFGEPLSLGRPHLFSAQEVGRCARAISGVPQECCLSRMAKLAGTEVHGHFFAPVRSSGNEELDQLLEDFNEEAGVEAEHLEKTLTELRRLLVNAGNQEHAILAVLV